MILRARLHIPFATAVLLVCVMASAMGRSAVADLTLTDAINRHDAAAVRALLAQRVDVNASDADGTTPLHWAAYNDNAEITRLLLNAGAKPGAANDYGVTPLSLACANASGDVVRALVQAGADANQAKWSGETPLMTCSFAGSVDGVKALLGQGAEVNARDGRRGQTALMWAVFERHPEVVQALIAGGADVRARSRQLEADGFTPMVFKGNGASAQVTSQGGFTALLFAARTGDMQSTKLLLDAGADVNDASPDAGTALVVAAAAGHEELALYLLERGANPNAKDGSGITPLHYALRSGLKSLHGMKDDFAGRRIEDKDPAKLLDAAANTDEALKFVIGNALQRASQSSTPQTATSILPGQNMHLLTRALLSKGADPNARITVPPPRLRVMRKPQVSVVGATPFLLAAAAADVTAMRALAESRANTRVGTEVIREEFFKEAFGDDNIIQGNATPLLVAAGLGRRRDFSGREEAEALEAVKIAVALGADVNEASAAGWTAVHAAAFLGADSIVEYLAQIGAKLDVRNGCGQTPLSLAAGTDARGLLARVTPHLSTVQVLKKHGAGKGTPPEPVGRCVEGRFGLDYATVTSVADQSSDSASTPGAAPK